MSSSQDAMNTLSAQWYNAITTGLGLSKKEFQLVQGADPIGTSSENLWDIFDSIPPDSATTFYDPAQVSSFHQAYAGIISALIPQGADQFAKDMGDYATSWDNYKKSLNPLPSGSLAWSKTFSNWANANLPQSIVPTVIGDYDTMLDDPITVAANQLRDVRFAAENPKKYAYTTTYEQLQLALDSAAAKNVSLNSSTTSGDISKSWAHTEHSGVWDLFGSIKGAVNTDTLTEKILTAGLTIVANFSKVVTLAAGPLKSPSSDSYLQNFTPWFNSAALSEGYHTRNNTVWKSSDSITWESSFGGNGSLQRFTSALVIVDGIDIVMTSNAGLSSQEQSSFEASMEAGIFPFYEGDTSGGWVNHHHFDDHGNMTVTSSSPSGNPQILGVLVTSMQSVMD